MVSIPDVEEWDAAVPEQVKSAALGAGRSLRTLSDGLGSIKTDLGKWHGDAADAWRIEHDKTMVHAEDQHGETGTVADLMDTALEDVRWCIEELQDARAGAESMGMTIAPDGTVTDPDAGKTKDQQVAAQREQVRSAAEQRLKALLVKANATDVEIGNALRAAVADKPLPVPDGAPHTDPAVILSELQRANDQAVVDQMAKIHGIQKQIDAAAVIAATHNPGSTEADAAFAKIKKLRGDMATALNDLGKIPDYSKVDPNSVTVSPDGHFLFNQTKDGITTQVYGQFKNGTGQVFDQAKGTSYSFKDGKLVGTTTPDPGKVTPDDELLFNAVTIAVGAPEAAVALKAGGEASIYGLKALFGREVFAEAGGITGENLLPKALAAAELRADNASANLGHHLPPVAEHPLPPAAADRPVPHGADHTPTGGGSHVSSPPPDAPGHSPTLDGRGHPNAANSGEHPITNPAPDGLDHHAEIGPMPPPTVNDINKWLPEINHDPNGFDPLRAVNCGSCALAVDQRLSGQVPDATAGLGTLSTPKMEAATGLHQVPGTPSQIEQYLINQGAGAHTVVGIDRAGAPGHWFNAYFDGSKVYAIDGQTGQVLGWPPNMDMLGHPVTNWDYGVRPK